MTDRKKNYVWVCEVKWRNMADWKPWFGIGASEYRNDFIREVKTKLLDWDFTWPWVRDDPNTGKLRRQCVRFRKYEVRRVS